MENNSGKKIRVRVKQIKTKPNVLEIRKKREFVKR
jgi:hypothetical protein